MPFGTLRREAMINAPDTLRPVVNEDLTTLWPDAEIDRIDERTVRLLNSTDALFLVPGERILYWDLHDLRDLQPTMGSNR